MSYFKDMHTKAPDQIQQNQAGYIGKTDMFLDNYVTKYVHEHLNYSQVYATKHPWS